MKDFWKESENVIFSKKRIIITSIIVVLIIIFTIIIAMYINNRSVRRWIDKYILHKEITQNNLASIEIENVDNSYVYAFNKYIGILNKNNFKIYDNTGKKQNDLTLEIAKPIFNGSNRYLAVGEEKGKKLYLIDDKEIAWEKDVEGNISEININRNGYVAVTIVDTSYKTIIAMYDNKGELLFNTYLSSTRVVSTSISNDNKYLAIAEIDTSGTMIQSNVKIISIEEGKQNAENSIKNVHNGENNELITNLKYQEKNKLLCMYAHRIICIKEDGTIETIQEYGKKKISFASIELANNSITIEEKSSGLFTADSVVNIINSENKSTSLYTAESVTKEIYTNNNVIALNLGSEVEFINTNGWLIKKYTAEQEITSIVLSNSIAGIVYRDKVEIINL